MSYVQRNPCHPFIHLEWVTSAFFTYLTYETIDFRIFIVYMNIVFIKLQAQNLQVDESSFTGELEPRHKYVKSLTVEVASAEHVDNIVYMGTLVRCGHGKVMN